MEKSFVQQFSYQHHSMTSLQKSFYTTLQGEDGNSKAKRVYNADKVERILEDIVLNPSYSQQTVTFIQQENTMKQLNQYFHTQLSMIQKSVGMIIMNDDDKLQMTGTGIALSSRIVVTCAHCFLNKYKQLDVIRKWKANKEGFRKNITKNFSFYVQELQERVSIRRINRQDLNGIQEIFISPDYLNGNDKKDWAIVRLKKDVKDVMEVACLDVTKPQKNPDIKDRTNNKFNIVIPDKTKFTNAMLNGYYIGYIGDLQQALKAITQISQSRFSLIHPFQTKSLMSFFYQDDQLMINYQCKLGEASSGGPLISIQYTSSKQFQLNLIGLHKQHELLKGNRKGCTLDQTFISYLQDCFLRFSQKNQRIQCKYFDRFHQEIKIARQLGSFDSTLRNDTDFKYLVQFLEKIQELAENYLFLEIQIKLNSKYERAAMLFQNLKKNIQEILKNIFPIFDLSYKLSEWIFMKLPLKDFVLENNFKSPNEKKILLQLNNSRKILHQSLKNLLQHVFDQNCQPNMRRLGKYMANFLRDAELDVLQRLFVLIQLLKQFHLDDLLIIFRQHCQDYKQTLTNIVERVRQSKSNDQITSIILKCNTLSRINIFSDIITHKQQYQDIPDLMKIFKRFQTKIQNLLTNTTARYQTTQRCKFFKNLQMQVKNPKSYKLLILRVFTTYYQQPLSNQLKKKVDSDYISATQFIFEIIDKLQKFITDNVNLKLRKEIQWPREKTDSLERNLRDCVKQELLYLCMICQHKLSKRNIMAPLPQNQPLGQDSYERQEIERRLMDLQKQIDEDGLKIKIMQQKLAKIRKNSSKQIIQNRQQDIKKAIIELKKKNDQRQILKQQNNNYSIIETRRKNQFITFGRPIQRLLFEDCGFTSFKIKKQCNFAKSYSLKQKMDIRTTTCICKEGKSVNQARTKFSKLKQLKRSQDMTQYQIYYNFIGSIMYKKQRTNTWQETGTGVKFGKGLALTAYHTVKDYLKHNLFVKGDLKFKIIGAKQQPDCYDVIRIKICEKYDWAIFYLQELNEQQRPYEYPFKVITFNNNDDISFLVGKSYYCQIVGFCQGKKKDSLFMSVARIFINRNYKSTIQYTNQTSNRMSGAAVLIYPTGQYGQYDGISKLRSKCKPYILAIHLGSFNQENLQIYGDKYYVERYNFGIKMIHSQLQSILSQQQNERTAIDLQSKTQIQISPQQVKEYQNELNKYFIHENSYQFSEYAYERSKSKFIQNYYDTLKISDGLFIKHLIQEIIDHGRCDIFFTEIDFQNILSFSDSPTRFVNRLFNSKIRTITPPKSPIQYKDLWADTIQSCRQAIQKFYIRKEIREFLKAENRVELLKDMKVIGLSQLQSYRYISLQIKFEQINSFDPTGDQILAQRIQKYHYYYKKFRQLLDLNLRIHQQSRQQSHGFQLLELIKRFIILKKVREIEQKRNDTRQKFRHLYEIEAQFGLINESKLKENLQSVDGLLFSDYFQCPIKYVPSSFEKFCQRYYCHEYILFGQLKSYVFQPRDQFYSSFLENAGKLLKLKIFDQLQYQTYKFLVGTIRVNIDQMSLAEDKAEDQLKQLLRNSIQANVDLSQAIYSGKLSPESYKHQLIKRAKRLLFIQKMDNIPKKQIMIKNLMNFNEIKEQQLNQYKSVMIKYKRYVYHQLKSEEHERQIRQFYKIQPSEIAKYCLTEDKIVSQLIQQFKYVESDCDLLDINRIILEECFLFNEFETKQKGQNAIFKQSFSEKYIDFELWERVLIRLDDLKDYFQQSRGTEMENSPRFPQQASQETSTEPWFYHLVQ